ncbi:3-hydroxyacyl-CoA dehydrogenase family protein [Vallitalea guaymasensis]|uniref:3-hydroxyacyl-CoA dehydrogenase family protein n=2 Tax=Vallitalea guaymasensis TaxID=1185412 RepID=A0A8J8M8R1_9FIRM|nr:3-hydroxyacyl-CoA dehydrogenase family protein [Vallitalea guaymasensis]QUH28429.1 3-hydroxyacyl-CoA dehydrogenase family protein [Vallitalea guaymasensis]
MNIGIIGAGVMGRGVALAYAQYGHNIVLVDIEENVLEEAKKQIIRDYRFQGMYGKKCEDTIQNILGRITFTTQLENVEMCEYIIENVTENWEIKKNVYLQLNKICNENTIYAVNTSCFSITRVGALMDKPENVIGSHYMNPAHIKSTVEVIKGYHTSEKTIDTTLELLKTIEKEGVVVNDLPGFVSNRVLMLTVNEAIYLVHEGVAEAKDVDKIFKQCFGHKMGPLETADLIGLDTILFSVEVLYESYCDSKYRPCPLLKKMVNAGLLGRKSGQGFYAYNY